MPLCSRCRRPGEEAAGRRFDGRFYGPECASQVLQEGLWQCGECYQELPEEMMAQGDLCYVCAARLRAQNLPYNQV